MKEFTKEELALYGPESEMILLALNGTVYNVTTGKEFYGPGAPYSVFAGKDATFGLATMTLTCDATVPLNSEQLYAVEAWQDKFDEKYPVVGRLV